MSVNRAIVERAEHVAAQARDAFLAIHGEGAVVLSAVAGAGKSTFVAQSVGTLRGAGLRVAVSAPTNEQVFSLVRSIADANPTETVTFLPAQKVELPTWAHRSNVAIVSPAYNATRAGLIVGTIDKLASARHPRASTIPQLGTVDALVIDEAYQADAARYFAVGDLAPAHLLVGDGGQIDPFSTVEAGRQWRGLPEDPLQTAVGVLRRNHPETPLLQFPITRRLDSRAATVARAFYPDEHHFEAAVGDGARELRLHTRTAGDTRTDALDRVLDVAATEGWAHLELPATEVLVCDPETVKVICDLVSRLVARSPVVRCERHPKPVPLEPNRIAVGVSHNDQKDLLRARLDAVGLGVVKVDTANKLQGLEYDVVVCWHPLAGLTDADEFHVDSGRLCVLTTRHRHACIVVGRRGDRELVQGLPPSTPAWPGVEDDSVLGGWDVHRQVFDALERVRVELS
jgi:AAA domain